MAILLNSASSQALNNATLAYVGSYPFTVGVWYKITSASFPAQTIFSFSDTATTNNYFNLRTTGSAGGGQFRIAVRGGSGESELSSGINYVVGGWMWGFARFISATNRRIVSMAAGGVYAEAQDVTSRTPAGIDNARIGGLLTTTAIEYFTGYIAELWYTDTDIQPGGAAIDRNLAHQLAFKGPFSVPQVAGDIIEYRSLRLRMDQTTDSFADGESYSVIGKQPWTLVGAPIIAEHPPLASDYVYPGMFKSNMII